MPTNSIQPRYRILLVDSDHRTLEDFRRILQPMQHAWELVYVTQGQAALALLADGSVDLLITELHLPDMSGAAVLAETRSRSPQTVRMIYTQRAETAEMLQVVPDAHQRLEKPCRPELLLRAIARTEQLRSLLRNARLVRLISALDRLPSPPLIYFRVLRELHSPDASLRQVGELIAQDVAMSAKVLRLINSAFFGLHQQVTSPAQAVGLLGLDLIRSLVLTIGIFSHYDQPEYSPLRRSLDSLQQHCLKVAHYARTIAKAEKASETLLDEAAVAGMVHDVGKLVLMTSFPQPYAQAALVSIDQRMPQVDAETAVLGATHAEVGAYLLGLWGFSSDVLTACALHHTPLTPPLELTSALIVQWADHLSYTVDPRIPAAAWYQRNARQLAHYHMEQRLTRLYTLCQQQPAQAGVNLV